MSADDMRIGHAVRVHSGMLDQWQSRHMAAGEINARGSESRMAVISKIR